MTQKFTPTPTMIEAAEATFMAMAAVQTIEPVVTAYRTKILADGQWRIRQEMSNAPILRKLSAKQTSLNSAFALSSPRM
jgi:hypothetical protein